MPPGPWAIPDDPRMKQAPDALFDPDDFLCPRCKGAGTEFDMDRGLRIVCRDCSGSGRTDA